MRLKGFMIVVLGLLCACSDNRLFEDYVDFEDRYWAVSNQPVFEFSIADTVPSYSIYCNLRNAESYPFADFRFTYTLTDSTGRVIDKRLVSEFLFDKKTGKPFGDSGLGDIYDHQFLLIKEHRFVAGGKYSVKFEQFMRRDTLDGILAVGLRVEQAQVK